MRKRGDVACEFKVEVGRSDAEVNYLQECRVVGNGRRRIDVEQECRLVRTVDIGAVLRRLCEVVVDA